MRKKQVTRLEDKTNDNYQRNKQTKNNLTYSGFCRLVDHRMKIKENKKRRGKYLDHAREQKKNFEIWGWRW